jgi:opacity protein-like surface antigen
MRSTFDAGFVVDKPRFESSRLGDSTIIGLGVGYKFNNWLRADVTGEYRTAGHFGAVESYGPTFCTSASGRCYDSYSASISNAVFLANGYVDIGTWYGLTPFVGAGVGFASSTVRGLTDTGNSLGAQGFGWAADKTTTNFAWALMAGLGYTVNSNLKLELGYRYLNMGTVTSAGINCTNAPACGNEVQRFKLASHDIRLGMRWMFNEPPPPPMPPMQMPLVRKY